MSHHPTLGFVPDVITEWVVRRPGCVAWSHHPTLAAAAAERRRADDAIGGHCIYAVHASGAVTGPYPHPVSDPRDEGGES